MKAILNKPWFVAVLVLTAAILVAFLLPARDRDSGPATPIPEVSDGPEVVSGNPAREPVGETLKALPIPPLVRDPFAARVGTAEVVARPPEAEVTDTLHLSAIWTQDGRTLVLLNDRICQNGDVIGRLQIESATPDGVWLAHWKGRDFLSIGHDFTLHSPARQPAPTANLPLKP